MVINRDPLEGMSPQDLEASIRGVADAPEPGTARVATMREILSQMEDDLAVPNVGELKRGHGYAFIWDTRTYERSVISKNLLSGALTWKREDKSFFYTTSQPKDGGGVLLFPWRGTLKCLLHPEHPNVAHYKHLGLPECRKSNIPSEYMVMMHIEHKHSDAWNIIKTEKAEAERIEDRAERKAMIEELMRRGGASPVVVDEVIAASDPVYEPVPGPPSTAGPEPVIEQHGGIGSAGDRDFVVTCTDLSCGLEIRSEIRSELESQLKTHMKTHQSWAETCETCGFVPVPAKSRLGANSRMRKHKKEHGGG